MVDAQDAEGKPIQRLSRYTEVATGLNYQDENGVWQSTEEKVIANAKGASAENGYYTVVFGENLRRKGVIEIKLPNGQKQVCHPLGLFYFDRADGRWVVLSQIQEARGVIVPPNQILYANAFDSLKGDLLYTYQKGVLRAEAILR